FNFVHEDKMNKIKVLFLLAVFTALPELGFAQDGLQVFGFTQAYYTSFSNTWTPAPPAGEEDYKYNHMGIGQLNLLFNNNFGDDFSAFINFELTNNYSSSKGFGSFNLQEAYFKWDGPDYLKVKFGSVIPQFNGLYQVYNKTPLMPFLVRPKLYEVNMENLVDIFDILPQKALLHINGTFPLEKASIEYSAFLTNPVNKFISSPNNDLIPGYVSYGQSAVNYVGLGGRLGFNYGGFNVGVSVSADKDNKRRFISDVNGNEVDLGDLLRTRLGFDFDFNFAGFNLKGEYLKVSSKVTSDIQDSLNAWNNADPYYIGNSFDKEFYYVLLQYNITEKLFAYTMYDYLTDKVDPFFFGLEGYYGIHVGGGYNLNDNIVLKAQYILNFAKYDVGTVVDPVRDFRENNFSIGASIMF
ncbi:MAG TPA: hypothetical protein PK559_14380, partial [Ignavibacteriaceae bacterium]|nr:hypothetical protein [Ignavibacteriaceae bacterium]